MTQDESTPPPGPPPGGVTHRARLWLGLGAFVIRPAMSTHIYCIGVRQSFPVTFIT